MASAADAAAAAAGGAGLPFLSLGPNPTKFSILVISDPGRCSAVAFTGEAAATAGAAAAAAAVADRVGLLRSLLKSGTGRGFFAGCAWEAVGADNCVPDGPAAPLPGCCACTAVLKAVLPPAGAAALAAGLPAGALAAAGFAAAAAAGLPAASARGDPACACPAERRRAPCAPFFASAMASRDAFPPLTSLAIALLSFIAPATGACAAFPVLAWLAVAVTCFEGLATGACAAARGPV